MQNVTTWRTYRNREKRARNDKRATVLALLAVIIMFALCV